ncbi:Nucleolysin TIAR [Smittium culicis]|uniref:Nucleolysin TIAR n=1 Tax=Smittium culicis TaxID=133412 RepID=A0A1R1YDW2_9FUNG|nr:Nucleolysin TIAR [Smittium culicis]OMJ24886.1 Nucleolysin TIAR [Smittium culicis]
MDHINNPAAVPPQGAYPSSQSQAYGFSDDASTRTLYVGNLDARTNERMLFEIFSTSAQVSSVKVIADKATQQSNVVYGFIEFADRASAELSLAQMNGRKIFDHEIKVNWAFSGASQVREDTSTHSHIFVGDLSPEVNDQILAKAFSIFPSMSVARVMWDITSGKSRGYGFVAFREQADAEQAINTMNGEWLGSRAIRVNWANQKVSLGSRSAAPQQSMNQPPSNMVSYESVHNQAAPHNCTVYCGNLTPFTTQDQLLPLFGPYGYVIDIRMQPDRGYAFVKMDTHEAASMAIVGLTGFVLNGRPIKCSWGKDQYAHKLNGYQHMTNPQYAYPYAYGMPQQQQHFAGHPGQMPGAPMVGMQPGVDGSANWAPNAGAGGYSYDPYSYYNYMYTQNPDQSQAQIPGSIDPLTGAPHPQHPAANPPQ